MRQAVVDEEFGLSVEQERRADRRRGRVRVGDEALVPLSSAVRARAQGPARGGAVLLEELRGRQGHIVAGEFAGFGGNSCSMSASIVQLEGVGYVPFMGFFFFSFLLFFKGLRACKRLGLPSSPSYANYIDRHSYGWPSGVREEGGTESKRQDILQCCNGREKYGQREDNEEQSKPVHVHFWRCGIGPEPCTLFCIVEVSEP